MAYRSRRLHQRAGGQEVSGLTAWHCIPRLRKRMTDATWHSPSPFVLSAQGKEAQIKIWNETVSLLQEQVPELDVEKVLKS